MTRADEPLDLGVVGEDAEPAAPVAAPLGEWVTATRAGLVADCSIDEPGDGLRVRVRDAGGTVRVVEADGAPDLMFPELAATVTSSDAATLTTGIRLTNPGSAPLEVIALEAATPGLATTGPELPFEVPPGESPAVPLTWTVTNCSLALQWLEPQLLFAHTGEMTARGHHPLDNAARAELVLLTDRVCGSTP